MVKIEKCLKRNELKVKEAVSGDMLFQKESHDIHGRKRFQHSKSLY